MLTIVCSAAVKNVSGYATINSYRQKAIFCISIVHRLFAARRFMVGTDERCARKSPIYVVRSSAANRPCTTLAGWLVGRPVCRLVGWPSLPARWLLANQLFTARGPASASCQLSCKVKSALAGLLILVCPLAGRLCHLYRFYNFFRARPLFLGIAFFLSL